MSGLDALLAEIRACRVCAEHLPLGPRPVCQLGVGARLLIVGQAPGTKVHASGRVFDDASGVAFRRWLGLDAATFWDPERVAFAPMGFCYPGKTKGGDAAPRPECAPLWQARVRAALPRVALTLLVGAYAQAWHLGDRRGPTLADTCRAYADHLPGFWPIPHPSPRNRLWLARNPWFEGEVVPRLQARVAELVSGPPPSAAAPAG